MAAAKIVDSCLAALSNESLNVSDVSDAQAQPAEYEFWIAGETGQKSKSDQGSSPAEESFPCQDNVICVIEDFVLMNGHGIWAEHEPRLFQAFDRFNSLYFEGKLPRSEVKLGQPPRPTKILGTHHFYGDHGTRCEILINVRIFTGEFPGLNSSEKGGPGHQRYVDDVLLHEMMHAWCSGVHNTPELGHHGHGPYFAEQCNRVGAMLGLAQVRNSRATGEKTAHLESCSHWPHNVRPKNYYLGAHDDDFIDDESESDSHIMSDEELNKLLKNDYSFAAQMVKSIFKALVNAKNTTSNHRKLTYAIVDCLRRQCQNPAIFQQYPEVLPTLEDLADHAA